MATTDLPQPLRTYLATCSAEHADQIIKTLRESLQRNAPNGPSANTQTAMEIQKAPRKKQRVKKPKPSGGSGGPKRPLNSWMAFRKYYNASLAPLTQKAISKILMMWWREDPFSAKWAILAKAYSVLRGSREKDEAPLDEFLSIAVPLVGIVPPHQYPQMMGWQLTQPTSNDQETMPQVVRAFVPNLDTFEEKYTSTTLSVDDLVEHCKHAGFIKNSSISPPHTGAQGVLIMAVQPSSTVTAATSAPGTAPQVTLSEKGDLNMPLSPFSLISVNDVPAAFEETPVEPFGKTALTRATAVVANAAEYPYNNLFDPTSEFEVSFNPTEETPGLEDGGIYDAFDPSTNMAMEDILNLDWSQFINDDSLS